MLDTSLDFFPEPLCAEGVGLGTLQESAISANHVGHAVLCSSMELYSHVNLRPQIHASVQIPSDAKTIGLSALEGSVNTNTSAKPSEASLNAGGKVPVILR